MCVCVCYCSFGCFSLVGFLVLFCVFCVGGVFWGGVGFLVGGGFGSGYLVHLFDCLFCFVLFCFLFVFILVLFLGCFRCVAYYLT